MLNIIAHNPSAEADPEGSGPLLLKLTEQKVVRKVRFVVCKSTKYFPKMSYFALKSLKIVSFWGSAPRSPGLRRPFAPSGPPAKISGSPLICFHVLLSKIGLLR